MKVTMITHYWKNSPGGGVKNYVINLVDALKEEEVDINVLFREGVDPEHFHCGKNKLAFALACYRHLRKIQPDVVHSHGTWYCLLPGVLYKRFHGCTLVHTFHTEPCRKLSFPAKIFFQSLLNACDCVTFVSKGLQEQVVEVDGFSFPKTAITYAGIKVKEVSEGEVERFREQYGIKDAPVLLAQALTAHPLKAEGMKLLIKAVRILRETYPNILLIVTREGKYSNELKALAREMGMADRVIFTGDVENPLVPLKVCDVYTHIVRGEGGVSLSILEAMVMGKPIVASRVGGIPEAIEGGKNGILVGEDFEEIAQKIHFLLSNKKIARDLGKNAKLTVEERFTPEACARRFLRIYAGEI